MKALALLILCSFLLTTLQASALDAELQAVRSRVQAMSHGYYSEAQWTQAFEELAELRERAESRRQLETVIEIDILKAMVYSDMRRDPAAALALLEESLAQFRGQPVANVKQLYVQLAGLLARQGDERAIVSLIREFEESPHFDPVTYPFAGGSGPGDPLVVTRPRASGRDSITVSTMQRYRVDARYAPGRPFPDLEGVTPAGQRQRISDYQGRVVLVDFWFPEFTAWQRELPALQATLQRHHARGFVVIGVPLGRNPAQVEAMIRRAGLPWVQWHVSRADQTRLGVFGDARNFLLDANGMIVGRDLRGADLESAVQHLLRP
jgi:hypothetical protein